MRTTASPFFNTRQMSFTKEVATQEQQSETQNHEARDIGDIIILCFPLGFRVDFKYLLQRWRGEVENADGNRKAEQTFHKTFHPLNISVGTEPCQTGQKKKKKKI